VPTSRPVYASVWYCSRTGCESIADCGRKTGSISSVKWYQVIALFIGTKIGVAVALALFLIPVAYAQDAVPTEILQRALLIKVGNSTGTAFIIDHNGKVYIVTARHVAAALPHIKAIFQLWRSNKWEDVQTVRTIFPSSASVDIAIFETEEKIARPFQVALSGADEGPTMGQQVWFLGYPFGDTAMTSRAIVGECGHRDLRDGGENCSPFPGGPIGRR
jgi:S1-C subfamily serine protease